MEDKPRTYTAGADDEPPMTFQGLRKTLKDFQLTRPEILWEQILIHAGDLPRLQKALAPSGLIFKGAILALYAGIPIIESEDTPEGMIRLEGRNRDGKLRYRVLSLP